MNLPSTKDYPKRIAIGEDLWRLKFVKRIPCREKGVVGLCDPDKETIYILKGMSKLETLSTFIHEALHASENYGVRISHKSVYLLEALIMAFLVENC